MMRPGLSGPTSFILTTARLSAVSTSANLGRYAFPDSLNGRSPAARAVVFAGRGQFAAFAGAGTKRIVGRSSAYEW